MKKKDIIENIKSELRMLDGLYMASIKEGNELFVQRYFEALTAMNRLAFQSEIISKEEYDINFNVALANMFTFGGNE